MTMKFNNCILMLTLCLMSCSSEYDAEKAAERFCDCMKEQKAVERYTKAYKVCDDDLKAKNRYYRLWTVDMRYRELDSLISNDTRDSVKLFMTDFTDYTTAHCCKETLECRRDAANGK